MIQLKDVLHLYMGSEVRFSNDKYLGNPEKMSPEIFWEINRVGLWEDVKPLLRPLSEMTEEEHEEWKEIKFNMDFKLKPLYTDADYNSFVWLLAKGFDLFGLIESGQAIDLTSVSPKRNKK